MPLPLIVSGGMDTEDLEMTGICTSIKYMAILALIAGIFIEETAWAGLMTDEVQTAPAKSSDGGKKVETMSDQALAFRYLSAREILYGQLATIYESLNELRQEGQGLSVSIEYVMHNPDGTANQFVMSSLDDLEKLLDVVGRAEGVYAHQIRNRQEGQIMTRYQAVVSDSCPAEWIESGDVVVERNGLSFLLRQGEKAFEGAVVGEVVAIVFPGGTFPPLVGNFKSQQNIQLSDVRRSCGMRLVPSKGLAENQ